jgi:hypothetical protein
VDLRVGRRATPSRGATRVAGFLWARMLRYCAATTVNPISASAVNCGVVVAHVTVSPAVLVVHV